MCDSVRDVCINTALFFFSMSSTWQILAGYTKDVSTNPAVAVVFLGNQSHTELSETYFEVHM